MTGIAPWAGSYVGIPFLSGGRSRSGADCYGLIRLALMEQFNKTLPLLSGGYSDADNFAETEKIMKERRPALAGQQVGIPDTGDICVITFSGLPVHLGLYAGGGFILHTLKATGSVLQRMSDPLLAGRIEGWYRAN
jgi:cell wall-associated NlpC family hydrolase